MRFRKYHGLGNDYLVLEQGMLTPERVVAVCDRHMGLGSDGILEMMPSQRADVGLRIWNPDGSVAEKSGNGLRIFARWLVDFHDAMDDISIELSCGIVRCQVDGAMVTVQMGQASFDAESIPATEEMIFSPQPVGEVVLPLTAVGVGNPHCVVFLESDLDALPWRDWGAALEVSPLFPNRTNVQFARVIDSSTIEARVWERGAGETSASGSSACAIAAAAVRMEHCDGTVKVRMPGGVLEVTVGRDYALILKGPVAYVGEMTFVST
jgi:diaminopimelate epimerase